jgi:hypothetical protein
MSLKKSHVTPGIMTKGEARETVVTTSLAAMTNTTTTRVEEIMGAEERKSRFAISMAKSKAIGRMNTPSP